MLFGVSDEGRSKVELCVKRIKEVDHNITIETFTEWVTDENIHQFVRNCDLIVEECDDFRIKVLLWKTCQQLGISLLMASSQNGMIDVERYDCADTATRPFHLDDESVLDQLASSDLSPEAKNGLLSRVYNLERVSPCFLASGMEIGKSISSWPQLAEEVFLTPVLS